VYRLAGQQSRDVAIETLEECRCGEIKSRATRREHEGAAHGKDARQLWMVTGRPARPAFCHWQRNAGCLTLDGPAALGNDCKQCGACVTRKFDGDEKLGQTVGCGQCTKGAKVQIFLRGRKKKMRVCRMVDNTRGACVGQTSRARSASPRWRRMPALAHRSFAHAANGGA
jgi:hypothetical protein